MRAVATRDLSAFAVAGGNPAHVLQIDTLSRLTAEGRALLVARALASETGRMPSNISAEYVD